MDIGGLFNVLIHTHTHTHIYELCYIISELKEEESAACCLEKMKGSMYERELQKMLVNNEKGSD